ncbi:MAG: hypothetical protein GY722_07080 [bacterium]|nr:hypothetical protein [bacterium]
MNQELLREYRHQKEWSGYVVGRRAAGALAKSRAYLAIKNDPSYRFRWEPDDCADWSWLYEQTDDHDGDGLLFPRSAREGENWQEVCILEKRCGSCGAWECIASLCGIHNPDDNYKRVVEAELSEEAS